MFTFKRLFGLWEKQKDQKTSLISHTNFKGILNIQISSAFSHTDFKAFWTYRSQVHTKYTDPKQTKMISICRDRRIMGSYNAGHTTHNGT